MQNCVCTMLFNHARALFLTRLCSILLFCSSQLNAQFRGNQFVSLPNDPGLYIADNHCIVQDSSGFLWFGTYSGLYRYDGYEFKIYQYKPTNDSLHWGERATYLYVDRRGDLWVVAGSLARLNKTTGRFQYYWYDPSDSTSVAGQANVVLESADDKFWIGTEQGVLDLLDPSTGACTHFRHDPLNSNSLNGRPISALLEDHTGVLWLGTWGGGLTAYNPQLGLFRHFRHDPADSSSLGNNEIKSLCETSDGMLWVGTWEGGLDRLDPTTGCFTHFRHNPKSTDGLSDDVIFTLLQSHDGTLWVGTWNGGLSWSDNADGQFHSSGSSPFRNYGFTSSNITSLFEDRNGILWAGCWRGVKYMDTHRPEIVYQLPPLQARESRPTGTIQTLLQDRQGRLWVGTLGGLACFDRPNKTYRFYRRLPGDRSNPTHSWIFSLAEDSSGNVWIGGSRLWCLNKETYRFTIYEHSPRDSTSLSRDGAGPVFVSRDGTPWIGAGAGRLDQFDRRTGTFLHHRNDQRDPSSLGVVYTNSIVEDEAGTLWIGTDRIGLYAYDRRSGQFTHYVHDPATPSSLISNRIWSLLVDRKGGIWVRTINGELDRLNKETDAFEHISRNAGLQTGVWGGLQEDRQGGIWLFTVRGIVRLDPVTRSEQTYSPPLESDLNSTEDPLETAPIVKGDGRLLLATGHGVVVISPDSIALTPVAPPLVITGLKVFGTELNVDSAISGNRELRLPYSHNAISFDFAVMDLTNPQRNQFAYMLEGIDKDWIQCGTRHNASFANLEPGRYVFQVKGANSRNVWNDAGIAVTIVITPPWWRSPWAYGLYILLLFGAFYGAWRLQVRRLRIRHALEMTRFEATKLQEVDALKSRFFANISHEFRTPLTLILGPVRQLGEELQDVKKKEVLKVVHRNASRLLDLVNQLLDISKLESGNMKLQTTPHDIVHLLQTILQSFCPYAERKRIASNFRSAEQEVVVYIDRDKIEKVFNNVLSNAFKFTPEGGHIDVSVTRDNSHVSVHVCDTGIGIPREKIPLIFDRFYQVDGSHTREQEGTGIGLSLTRELVELHRGTIAVESEEGYGSIFTIRLPLGKAHLKPEEIHEVKENEETIPALSGLTDDQNTTSPTEAPGDLLKGAGKPVLLIIEDNDDVRQYVRCGLEAEYRVLEARDGEEGWDVAVRETPDIIVSDVMMPRMDGYELCKRLKTDERTSHIPVILLTAKAASRDRIEGYETGADEYITKPFEPPELRARLSNLLEQRKRLHEHFRKHGLFEVETGRVTSVDQKFLERLMATIGEKMSDPSFGVELLAENMAVSRSLLLKKLEALIGEPPTVLIRRTRLEKAAQLIGAGFGNISQVALEVGFNNPSYFAECFRRQFGVAPSEFIRDQGRGARAEDQGGQLETH